MSNQRGKVILSLRKEGFENKNISCPLSNFCPLLVTVLQLSQNSSKVLGFPGHVLGSEGERLIQPYRELSQKCLAAQQFKHCNTLKYLGKKRYTGTMPS